uniref:Uncharacterized protein n=1 Tax=Oryza rufipogon TaxID=4529 RepID=A0A0E0MYZ8_ORYRU
MATAAQTGGKGGLARAGCGARRAAREALAQLAVGQLGQGQEEDVLGREKEGEDGERKKKKKGRKTSTACSAERLSHVKSSTRTSSSRPAPWWRRSRMAAAVAVTSSPPRPSTSPRLSWSSWEADELEEAATAPRPSTSRRRRPASPRAAIATSVEAVVLAPGRRPRSVRAEVVAIAPRPPPAEPAAVAPRPPPAEPAEPTAIAPRPPPAESVPKPPPAVAAPPPPPPPPAFSPPAHSGVMVRMVTWERRTERVMVPIL